MAFNLIVILEVNQYNFKNCAAHEFSHAFKTNQKIFFKTSFF